MFNESLSQTKCQPLSIYYSQALIRKQSITPCDDGCQDLLKKELQRLGFSCHDLPSNGVSNFIASIGEGPVTFAFAGHTDVVPPGPLEKWSVNPFAAEIVNNELIGRGASDMKTGLAAMLAATDRVLSTGEKPKNRFLWLITSDEEGEAEFGSAEICRWLKQENIALDMCLVGEPTAKYKTGDNIKVGRRGSLSAKLTISGIQGHVAYPQYAENAVHKANGVIQKLLAINWEQGSEDFPGTSLQITHIHSGAFTDNIVPAECEVCFNIRYSSEFSETSLKAKIEQTIFRELAQFELKWERPCEPYLTNDSSPNSLITNIEQAIHKNTGSFPLLSTSGGTSDGRFFADLGAQVVEVGVTNQTIHQANEGVALTDIVTLEDIYVDVLNNILF